MSGVMLIPSSEGVTLLNAVLGTRWSVSERTAVIRASFKRAGVKM